MRIPTVLNRATLKAHFAEILKGFEAAHVRRVQPWLDDLITGAESLIRGGGRWSMSTSRQVFLTVKGVDYKIRFNHKATFRGGIELVRMYGNKDGPVGRPITSVEDAQEFAAHPQRFMPGYVAPKVEPKPVDHAAEIVKASRVVIEMRAALRDALKNLEQALARQDGAKRGPIDVTSPPAGQA